MIQPILHKRENSPELHDAIGKALDGVAKGVVFDNQLMKDLIYGAFHGAVYGTNQSIKTNGWSGIIKSGEMSENLSKLIENHSIVLYSQILVTIAMKLAEERLTLASEGQTPPYLTHPEL